MTENAKPWPLSWKSEAPLLKRALDGTTRNRSATQIVDRRQAEVEKLGPGLFVGPDGELVTPSDRHAGSGWTRDGHPVGPLRHGPRGRILSVR
jgi:hypothetical protein